MDARNHGDSPHTLKMSYELMSDDAARLLKAQRVDRSVIVGQLYTCRSLHMLL